MSFSQYADMAKAATKTDPPRRISHSGGPIWRIPLSMDDHTKRDARKFRGNLRNQAITLRTPMARWRALHDGAQRVFLSHGSKSSKPSVQNQRVQSHPKLPFHAAYPELNRATSRYPRLGEKPPTPQNKPQRAPRSEEHTSELQ